MSVNEYSELNQQDQDRFDYLMSEKIDKLHDLSEAEAEEQCFEANAIETIQSETVQYLLGKVAEKHYAHYFSVKAFLREEE
jgi:hypothetical protein